MRIPTIIRCVRLSTDFDAFNEEFDVLPFEKVDELRRSRDEINDAGNEINDVIIARMSDGTTRVAIVGGPE